MHPTVEVNLSTRLTQAHSECRIQAVARNAKGGDGQPVHAQQARAVKPGDLGKVQGVAQDRFQVKRLHGGLIEPGHELAADPVAGQVTGFIEPDPGTVGASSKTRSQAGQATSHHVYFPGLACHGDRMRRNCAKGETFARITAVGLPAGDPDICPQAVEDWGGAGTLPEGLEFQKKRRAAYP